ncbi:MAG: hypothetical protein ACE5Q3_08955, partial [Alphaproteobacteria bacterium]
IVNPLQHIPIVSTVYRRITGDEIAAPARLLGGGLFGGPVGLAAALVGVAVESATGKDIGEHALAMILPDDDAPSDDATVPGVQMASLVADDRPEENETAADMTTSIVWHGPRIGVTGTSALPAPPAGWLDVALAEAEASRQPHSVESGPPARPTGKPWIAAAMMQAMAKYEEMAKQRLDEPLVDLR